MRRLASGRLEHLARRIRPKRAWGDLILSGERTDLLRSIVDRYRHADVVFPLEVGPEKEGTLTHPDGRLQRLRRTDNRPRIV